MGKSKETAAPAPVKTCTVHSHTLWAIGKYIESVLRERDFKSPPETVTDVTLDIKLDVNIIARKNPGTAVTPNFDPATVLTEIVLQQAAAAEHPFVWLSDAVGQATAIIVDSIVEAKKGAETEPLEPKAQLLHELRLLLGEKLLAAKARIQPLLPKTNRAGSTVTEGRMELATPPLA